MFKLLTRTFVIAMAAAVFTPAVAAPAPAARWEQVETAAADLPDDAAVTVRDNNIYVTVARPTAVKLFTILGQPVSQATLPAGTSRFKVAARGIYILKLGSSTRRITI